MAHLGEVFVQEDFVSDTLLGESAALTLYGFHTLTSPRYMGTVEVYDFFDTESVEA